MKFIVKLCILISFCTTLNATQIKDIASIIGVRENQLIGYGLVVGLNGTGDGSSSEFTIQSLSNMLQTVNVKIDPNDIKSKNTAAVMVTAKLPPLLVPPPIVKAPWARAYISPSTPLRAVKSKVPP